MPFPESLKLSIRRSAEFKCCVCRAIGVEIHHIIPQEEQGPDTADNAAPLCPSCHEIYGANPTKRKFLREARDLWFEICSKSKFATSLTVHDLSRELQTVASKHDIAELRKLITATQSKNGLPQLDKYPKKFIPVPLDRFIQSLYGDDFGTTASMFKIFFDSRTWYEEASNYYDLLDCRSQFLKEYGEQTARRICLVACRDTGLDPKGFTEEQFADAVNLVKTTVMLITGHEEHSLAPDGFQCGQREDGEFLWRSKPKSRRVRKSLEN